ncbi:MAG: LamG domain-containing protein, partial [Patescibacteria group bacterium]
MKILKYKNIEVLKILSFSFIFFYFLLSIPGFAFAKINPYDAPASCSKDSQCVSTHGGGSCCMADIYSNESLYKYFTCISTSSNPSSCPIYSGVVTNKCWPSDVCVNGLDYAISGIVPVNGTCGPAIGLASITESETFLNQLKSENQFCSSGVMSTTYPKLNKATKIWTWTCNGQNGGNSVSCTAKYSDSVNQQINGVCYTYSTTLSSEPTQLCISGSSGPVVLSDGVFSWVCSGKNGGSSVSCSANAKSVSVVTVPETNPFVELANDPLIKPTTKNSATQTEIISSYPTIEQKPANVSSYSLLEKYVSPCSIKFDSECEVLDQKLLDVIKAKSSIQDAINAGKLNGDLKVARIDFKQNPPKELDNYKTGLTLTNIQKLRRARVFPIGLELAALCITGQIPCSDGYIYDVDCNGNVCVDAAKNVCSLDSDTPGSYGCGNTANKHKQRSVMGEVTLNNILAGYSVCDPLKSGYSVKNSKFCHLVNPNWILKDPKYMCESGTKNGPLLYVTDKQSQSNIRYETCPDISTCLTEKDNEDCNAYGYCLREKNIWRFDLSADSCLNQNVGCSKYTYTMGGKTTTLGFIADTTDKSVCDTSNSGCRKYSLVKTGSDTTDWSYSSADKIFLNNKVSTCDSTSEGCTAFIRRDSANLIKNSSFEEYKLSSDFSVKQASFWLPYTGGAKVCSNDSSKTCTSDANCGVGTCDYGVNDINVVQLETSSDNIPVYDGSNALVIQRKSSADASSYAGYSLNSDYFVDVEPNKTYTLSYYVIGYNISFTSNDIARESRGAYVNVKEYDQNKKIIAKKVCVAGDNLHLGSLCDTASDCGNGGACNLSSTSNNIIDIESFIYVSNLLSSTWTRKTVSFKTGLDTYYLDIIPVLSKIITEDATDKQPATVVFDAIQLQEGGNATTYSLYENSKVNYLKKAPDYANCYSSSSDKDKVFCSSFIKSCDKKDVGCRKYQKKDDDEYWLPGKPNEDNYCTSACKGYQLYKETGPSYNPVNGSSFQSFIDTTARSCSSGDAGCSQYTNLSTKATEYYSSIRTCVKQNDDVGVCEANGSYKGSICSSDADCGSVAGSCKKEAAQYADYFTYTGSETSGYKLNVYRLLRTKACSNNTNLHCSNDSDCGGNNTCGYYDNVYSPAVIASDSFSVCNADSYKKADHDPDCREFHGPKDSVSATGGSNGDYVLYYANMSDVIFVSNENCSYYSIVPYQSTISKTECDKVSYLSPSLRYVTSTSTCNIGIYIPESTTCASAALNCREYNGTSISSETLFSDSFENSDDGWKNKSGSVVTSPSISTESIFVNEHSLKIAYPESIIKVVAPEIINPEEKALYKLRLYAKNDSADGTLSTIRLKVGNTFSNSKQVSNDWRFIGFDIFSSTDLTSADASNYIEILNDGLVTANKTVNLFVDYVSVEKSSSVYVIKDTWNTPVSCDNSIDNPTGACNTTYQQLGFCTMQPNKVCLTGEKLGNACSTANDCSADGTNKGDKCDYPNKVCRWGDNKNSSCDSDDDCYNDPNSSFNINAKVDSCSYTTNGYRLELGKMIGCDEYIDSYNNDEFYVFNDLNLCSADKMGCEALYDTKNSKSYQGQEFNSDVDYSNIIAYYTFDDKAYLARNDYSSTNIKNIGSVVYVKDGVSSGAALFNGTNSMTEAISDSLKKATSNVSIYSWVRPGSFAGSVVSLSGYYNVSINSNSQVVCTINGTDNDKKPATISINSGDYKLSLNKWQNILCTYDGDRLKIYINGEFVQSSDDKNLTLTYEPNSSSLLKIGEGFNGSIDDLRIYNKFFDSKMAYDAYNDYNDNYYVEADELGYYIIDSKYSCDSKYKGCIAVGRNDDRYDSPDFNYSTAFLIVDPDKFKSSGNYSTSGVYDATMCKAEEEGCYSFKDATNSVANFKFPKNLCVYRTNVDVGIYDNDTGIAQLKTGWFKYDNKKKTISNEGCYLDDVTKTGVSNPKADQNSYRIVNSSDCEYRKDPVVVRRTFHGYCSYNPSKTCSAPEDCGDDGVCVLNTKYVTRPKQTTYYIYTGTCSDNSGVSCFEDSVCSSGYCLLERTNVKCDSNKGNPYCKPYGYDENPGVIDQFSNKSFEFNVCQSGSKIGSYCKGTADCLGAPCGSPWTVIGWFKKNSTKGCSDDGDGVIEYTDYIRDYNKSVAVCSEYGCTNFIEPTEKRCTAGNLNGFECSSNGDCGNSGECITDELNGSKYCKAKACNEDTECASGAYCDKANHVCGTVNKLNQSCVFDKDCGFGGVCTGNNIYSYINNEKINSSGCNGKVSRESGCVLFNDTSNPQLKFSSKLTYAGVKNGVAVSAITGDNSGGDSQKDSNLIIKVSRDRECSEWLTFDTKGSPTKQDYDVSEDNTGRMYPTCRKLSEDGRCLDGISN